MGAITLTEYEDRRIIQRYATSEERNINLSGTQSGGTSIEARIVNDGTDPAPGGADEITGWFVVDASPTTSWAGTILVPQGGWYNIQVRLSNETTTIHKSSIKVGVGIIFWMCGQSNAQGFFYNSNSIHPVASSDDLSAQWYFNMYDSNLLPSDPNYWGPNLPALEFESPVGVSRAGTVTLCNILAARYGCPVGCVNGAVGGSSSNTWNNASDTNVVRAKSAIDTTVDGEIEFIVWNQGEADAAFNPSEATYAAAIQTVRSVLRAGRTNFSKDSAIPFLINQLSAYIVTGQDNGYNNVRAAQAGADGASSTYLCATGGDFGLRNNSPYIHYNWEGHIKYAERIAQTVMYINGDETYYRGPQISSLVAEAQSQFSVYVSGAGSNLTPASGIVGFHIYDGVTEITPVSVTSSGNKITIVLPGDYPTTLTVHYLFGSAIDFVPVSPAEPAGSQYTSYRNDYAVIDNTTYQLPLEPMIDMSIDLSSAPLNPGKGGRLINGSLGFPLINGGLIN